MYQNLSWYNRFYVWFRKRFCVDSNPTVTDTCKYLRTFLILMPLVGIFYAFIPIAAALLGYCIYMFITIGTWMEVFITLAIVLGVFLTSALVALALLFFGYKGCEMLENKYGCFSWIIKKFSFKCPDVNFNTSFVTVMKKCYNDWKDKVCTKFTLGE